MHNALKDIQKYHDDDTGAVCERWHIDNKPLENQTLAHIHLVKGALGVGLVTHEVLHAALHIYGLVNDMTKLNDDDEPLAYLVGDLTSKLYKQLYKRNLIA